MRRQTSTFVFADNLINKIRAALLVNPAATLLTDPISIILRTDDRVIAPADEAADLTPATFAGYAANTVNLADLQVVIMPDGTQAVMAQVYFQASSGLVAPGEVVKSYAVLDGGGGALIGGEVFEEPVNFANPFDFLTLDVYVPISRLVDLNQQQ